MNEFLSNLQFSILTAFVCMMGVRTLHLRRNKAVNAFTLASEDEGIKRILQPTLVVIVVVWIVLMYLNLRGPDVQILPSVLETNLVNSTAFKVVGATSVVLGFVVYTFAWTGLGNSWRVGIDRSSPGMLVTGGVYRISRNPIYVFINIYFAGTFLMNGSLILLCFAVATPFNLHWLILGEERFLSKTFGLSFHNYCAKTKRYWTFYRKTEDTPRIDN
ncbi:methyltransferase family protein, partial [Chloroflexota bacterium]